MAKKKAKKAAKGRKGLGVAPENKSR